MPAGLPVCHACGTPLGAGSLFLQCLIQRATICVQLIRKCFDMTLALLPHLNLKPGPWMTSLPFVARKGMAIWSLFACKPRPRCRTGQIRFHQIRSSPTRVWRPKKNIWSSLGSIDDQWKSRQEIIRIYCLHPTMESFLVSIYIVRSCHSWSCPCSHQMQHTKNGQCRDQLAFRIEKLRWLVLL